MDNLTSGLEGIVAYLDDILVVGRSKEELQRRIERLLKQIKEYGFHLRLDKCEFFLKSIKYLGFIFESGGRCPDPENIRAIVDMPTPTDITKLRLFLGLMSYCSSFLPSLIMECRHLTSIILKGIPWNWSAHWSLLCSEMLITYYNPKLTIIVVADGSNYGVEAVPTNIFPNG